MRYFAWRCRAWSRLWWHEWLPFWVARQLPRKVAYFAFIRVHAASEVHWDFATVARVWEHLPRRGRA